MLLSAGAQVKFHGVSYRIDAYIGSGAVADAYRAFFEAGTEPVVIRLLRSALAVDSLEAQGLRHEARVLETLNKLEVPGWPDPAAGPQERLLLAMQTIRERSIIGLL